jgi:hypothetical protein
VILYFVSATTAHLRVRDFQVAPPVVLALVAAVALALRLASS